MAVVECVKWRTSESPPVMGVLRDSCLMCAGSNFILSFHSLSQSGVFLTLSLAVCPIFVCRFSECWHYKHTCPIIPNTCQHIEQARKAAYASALSSIGLCLRPWTHCSAILPTFSLLALLAPAMCRCTLLQYVGDVLSWDTQTMFIRFAYSGECCRKSTEAAAVDVAGQGYLSPWLAWDYL